MRHLALVLLPGITNRAADMVPATAALQRLGATVVPISYDAFGTASSIESLAARIWQAIQDMPELRGRVVVLVGFSMGSFVAQAMARMIPSSIPLCNVALVLIGGAPPGSMRRNASSLGRAYKRFTDAHEDVTSPVPLHRGIIAAAFLIMGVPGSAACASESTSPAPPTLVVHGERDDTLPAFNANDLACKYGAGDEDLVIVPNAPHNLFLAHAHEVESAMLQWAARRVRGACVADVSTGMVFYM